VLLGAVSKSLAADAAPTAVRLILPSAAMMKNPSALVAVLVAPKRQPVTATLSEAMAVPTRAPAALFSA
jgi:hypothetical protein